MNGKTYIANQCWQLDNFNDPNFDMQKALTDCYFYYYSKCTKNGCMYRHNPLALGHEIVCNRWLEERCFDLQCPNRHLMITKQRGKIPCYFETTSTGCTKPHCVFLHTKPRNNNTTAHPNRNSKADNAVKSDENTQSQETPTETADTNSAQEEAKDGGAVGNNPNGDTEATKTDNETLP